MKWSQWILVTCALLGSAWTSPVSVDSDSGSEFYPESSVFSSQRPLLNYRRRVLGIRYGEPYTTTSTRGPASPVQNNKFLTKSYYEEPKTEEQPESPQYADDDDEEGVTEDSLEPSSTVRIPAIPASLRRSFAQQIGTTTTTSTSTTTEAPLEVKPSKTKTSRRRKVKRPPKIKSTTSKTVDEDLGDGSTKKSNSTGDKNLALEIGSNDGKYALINQFFENTTNLKPPGLISYAQSEDFSKDNEETLGNVQENDIWLSEDHLLVLKGGNFDSSSKDSWQPIDGYERDKSKRPLKIPLDTDNPPPFPVFTNESGPPIFLGPPPPFGLPYPPPGFGNDTFDPSRLPPPPGMIPLFPNGTIPEFFGPPPGFNGGNNSFPPFPNGPGGFNGPRPGGGPLYGGGGGGVNQGGPPGGLYGPNNNNGYGYGGGPGEKNGTFPGPGGPGPFPFGPPGNFLPPPPGFNGNFTGGGGPFPFLPPLVLNPNDNETDDPSIFLPPPYDFDYHEDNSTLVPPGPFAPGLVVPPPKDFYSVYNRTGNPLIDGPTTNGPYSHGVTFQGVGRPQRPNAKKPKFPLTNPPDDSLEATLPRTTPLPLPVIPITFPKKRKQRPGKVGKSYGEVTNPKYALGAKDNEDGGAGESPVSSITEKPTIILPPRNLPTTTSTTSATPKKNYVYVRGQLKTLAEIAAEAAAENGFEKDQPPTPRPAFDELGYPNREHSNTNIEHEPIIVPYTRKNPTKEPPKTYFVNTPKYAANYEPHSYRKKDKNPTPTTFTYPLVSGPSGGGGTRLPPSSNPLVIQRQEQPTYPPNNNDQGSLLFYPKNNEGAQGQVGPVRPTYYTPSAGDTLHPSQTPQLLNPNSNFQYAPPQYVVHPNNQNTQIRPQSPQIYSSNKGSGGVTGGERNYPQTNNAGFVPAFGPPQQQRTRSRSRVIFPGEQQHHTQQQPQQQLHPKPQQQQQQQQPSPQLYNNQLLFQQPQPQGYYSPISQYRQSIPPSQFVPSAFFPGGTAGFPGFQNTQFFSPQQQYYQPFQQQQQQQHQQQPQTQNYSPYHQLSSFTNQQVVPLHRDILVNYREPLPQYNTESEAITTRAVATKAGPRPGGIYGTEPAGEGSSTASVQAGSFYSFQRGGPGGFSYKIRL